MVDEIVFKIDVEMTDESAIVDGVKEKVDFDKDFDDDNVDETRDNVNSSVFVVVGSRFVINDAAVCFGQIFGPSSQSHLAGHSFLSKQFCLVLIGSVL